MTDDPLSLGNVENKSTSLSNHTNHDDGRRRARRATQRSHNSPCRISLPLSRLARSSFHPSQYSSSRSKSSSNFIYSLSYPRSGSW